jgi:cytochrome P450
MTGALYWDPMDQAIDIAPYDIWRRLRDEAPVYRNDRHDFWALSRYDDVAAALKDTRTYSSSHGTVLEIMSEQPYATGMMLFADPPDHTRLRAMVSRVFTVRRMSSLEHRIAALCDQLLAPWTPGVQFDFVQDFAAQLPSMVIAELLGVPATEREWVREQIDISFHIEPDVGIINDISFGARLEIDDYLVELLAKRRQVPGDDLLSGLVQTDLSVREAADFAQLLVTAGTETVGRLLGWAAVLLDQHPDQRAALAAGPSLIPNAVEELLRYEGPSPVQARWTTQAVDVHGVRIPSDSKVLLLTSSAGRDERKYQDADRFDIHRQIEHHVAFGYGVHFCLGAALARLESRIALAKALARHPSWQVDHGSSVRVHTSTVRGWSSIPVL